MNDALPSSWSKESLVDISDFRRGSFPQPYGNPEWYDDNGFPFVQVYDLGSTNLLKPITKVRISALAAEKSVFVPKGSVLVSIQGSIGRVVVTQYDAYVDRTILIFTQISSNLDRDFFALMVREIFELKKNEADGGVIKTITKETLKDFLMVVPPLPEQQKIAKILTSVDEVIEKTQAQIDKLKDLKTGMMQELLTNGIGHTEFKDSPVGRIPAEWEVQSLDELSSFITSGSRGWAQYYSETGAIFIRIGNLTREHINFRFKDTIYVTPPNSAEGKRTLVQTGDVLISITADLGVIAVVNDDIGEAYVNQHVSLVRLNDSKISRWVGHFLAFEDSQKQFTANNDSGAKAGLNLSAIRNTKVALPKLDEMQKIVDSLDSIDFAIAMKRKKLVKASETKKALMQDLLTGKVRVKV